MGREEDECILCTALWIASFRGLHLQQLLSPSYDHHGIGEEVEWRPPLLYAGTLGHHIPTPLKVCQKMRKITTLTNHAVHTGAWGGGLAAPHLNALR